MVWHTSYKTVKAFNFHWVWDTRSSEKRESQRRLTGLVGKDTHPQREETGNEK